MSKSVASQAKPQPVSPEISEELAILRAMLGIPQPADKTTQPKR